MYHLIYIYTSPADFGLNWLDHNLTFPNPPGSPRTGTPTDASQFRRHSVPDLVPEPAEENGEDTWFIWWQWDGYYLYLPSGYLT